MARRLQREGQPLLLLALAIRCAGSTLKWCQVFDEVAERPQWTGVEHVARYVNEARGGMAVGGNQVVIDLQTIFVEATSISNESWFDAWTALVTWGCQVAFAQASHSHLNLLDLAAYLEAEGLIVMLAYADRLSTNPRTGLLWTRVWNGELSPETEHNEFIAQVGRLGASKLCAAHHDDSPSSSASANSAKEMAWAAGMDAVTAPFNHSLANSAYQDGRTTSASEDHWEDPYNPATWQGILDVCGPDADVMLFLSSNDGLSFQMYIRSVQRHFKATFMREVVSDPLFVQYLGDDADLTSTPAEWHASMGSDCDLFGSNQAFVNSYTSTYGPDLHRFSATMGFIATVVVLGSELGGSIDLMIINEGIRALGSLQASTFFGKVQWGLHNMQGRNPLVLQVLNGERVPVLPEAYQAREFVYPMPKWQYRDECVLPETSGQLVCEQYLHFCFVHDESTYTVWSGWEHVVHYVNDVLGGIEVGAENVRIRLKMNFFDEKTEEEWHNKWAENVAWGCQVALVHSDVFDFVSKAADLEAQGVIPMLASGSRWTQNPQTGAYWSLMWNGGISSTLYHRGLIKDAALNGAQHACVVYKTGWIWGTRNSRDAYDTAIESGMQATLLNYSHSASAPAAVQNAVAFPVDDEGNYFEVYDVATWRSVLDGCGDADLLISYSGSGDGISLMKYINDSRTNFKAIYMTKAPQEWAYSVLGDAGNFVTTPSQWHEDMVSTCALFGSNAEFTESYRVRYGEVPHYMSALTAFDATVAVLGAQKLAATSTTGIDAGIQALDNTETFFGRVQWGLRNMQGRDPVLLQLLNHVMTPVLPGDLAAHRIAFPLPTFDAREYCPAGTYQDTFIKVMGADIVATCRSCEPGKFSVTSNGTSEAVCNRCTLGEYSSVAGATACEQCPESGGFAMTTQFRSAASYADCVCPEMSVMALDGTCVECDEGLDCPSGSTLAALEAQRPGAALFNASLGEAIWPTVLPSYWVSWDDPLNVYLCRGAGACPGDLPESCTDNAEAVVCAKCEPGYLSDGMGRCQKCTSIETSRVLFPILPFVGGPIAISIMYDMNKDVPDKWSSDRNGLKNIFLLILTHYQVLAMLETCNVVVHRDLGNTVEAWSWTVDITSLARPACVGLSDFTADFTLKLMTPIAFAVVVLLTYGVRTFLARKLKKKKWLMDRSRLFNTAMGLIFTFYISIAAMSFSLFKCYKHPNGEKSLLAAPYILCGDATWTTMLAASVVAVVVYCVLLAGLFLYILWMAPSRSTDLAFMLRWQFLLSKFTPGRWWWSIPILLKGLFLNLGTAVFQDGLSQLIWIQAVLTLYLCAVSEAKPWRHKYANTLDLTLHIMLILVTSVYAMYATLTDETYARLAVFISSLTFVSPAMGCCFFVRLMVNECQLFGKKSTDLSANDVHSFSRHTYVLDALVEYVAEPFRTFVQSASQEEGASILRSMLASISDEDIKVLKNAGRLLRAEFFAEQEKGFFRKRLVSSSSEELQRMRGSGSSSVPQPTEVHTAKESKAADTVAQEVDTSGKEGDDIKRESDSLTVALDALSLTEPMADEYLIEVPQEPMADEYLIEVPQDDAWKETRHWL